MKKFILNTAPDPDGIVRLYEKDYHYLVHVRRFKAGDNINAVLPDGIETQLMVCSTADNVLTAQCLKPQPAQKGAWHLPPIILFQALPKGNKMDLIVRQATEGGISEIVPFECEYSSIKIKAFESGNKLVRWQRIIKEARQQSGSTIATIIKPALDFDRLIGYWEELKERYSSPGTGADSGIGILLHHEVLDPTGGTPLEQRSLHHYLGNNPGFVVLAVGPEGGFSPKEASRFQQAGFRPIMIGDTIFKAETAALYGAAAIRVILLERSAWLPNKQEKP